MKQRKQYKHKITGDIAEISSEKIYSSVDKNNFYYHLPSTIVENSNDWQEITKPEYTILCFKDSLGGLWEIFGEHDNYRKCIKGSSGKLDFFLELPNTYSIYTIRRESDGEIFTIGDKIDFNCNGVAILKEIHMSTAICDKGKNILYFVPESSYLGKWWNINDLIKVKQKTITVYE